VFGTQGLVGFACYFALMVVPVLKAPGQMRRVKRRDDRVLLTTFAYLVVICAVNMLPNMALPFLQFVFATGLAALMREVPRQEALERQNAAQADDPAQPATPQGNGVRSPAG
jgi:O-antigen ligase